MSMRSPGEADAKSRDDLRAGPGYGGDTTHPAHISLVDGEDREQHPYSTSKVPGFEDGSALVIHNFFTPMECQSIIDQATSAGFASVNASGYPAQMRRCHRSVHVHVVQ